MKAPSAPGANPQHKGEPEKLFGGVHVIFCGMEITCVQQLWKYIEFIKYGYNELIDMHIWCTYAIQHATDTNKPSAGDFFQLPPVKARTVYDDGRLRRGCSRSNPVARRELTLGRTGSAFRPSLKTYDQRADLAFSVGTESSGGGTGAAHG